MGPHDIAIAVIEGMDQFLLTAEDKTHFYNKYCSHSMQTEHDRGI